MFVDILKFFVGLFVIIFIPIAGLLYSINLYGRYQCAEYQRVTGSQTEYVDFDSCYIEHKGKIVRYEVYKNMMIAAERDD